MYQKDHVGKSDVMKNKQRDPEDNTAHKENRATKVMERLMDQSEQPIPMYYVMASLSMIC